MEEGQQPKYLNSPETPIYVKGRTLYGLHLAKAAIAKAKHAVMVEGYFDVAQALQAGIAQRRRLVRDGVDHRAGAAVETFRRAKSSSALIPMRRARARRPEHRELLVAEGFQVNVAVLPAGDDPDTFIQKQGGAGLPGAVAAVAAVSGLPARSGRGRTTISPVPEDRREFLTRMLEVAARIPDAAARDQFADRLSHKAQITEEVVRAEIRKAAVQKKTDGAGRRSGGRPGWVRSKRSSGG